MADPVSIVGTVVGVASLAIQVTDILRSYWKGVSNFQDQVEQILVDTQQLSEVLKKLQDFLERDSTRLSRLFTTTSTLYSANVRCEIRLSSLVENLRRELEGSRKRKLLKAMRWPLNVEETQSLSNELRGHAQTFHFALTLDGCQLLLQSSDEVTRQLQRLSLSTATSAQQMEDIASVLKAISALPQTTIAIRKGVQQLEDRAVVQEGEQALSWLASDLANSKHQTIRKHRLANTGEWFFRLNSYIQWHDGNVPILWGQGRPGVGKSVLMYAPQQICCLHGRRVRTALTQPGLVLQTDSRPRLPRTKVSLSSIVSIPKRVRLKLLRQS